MLRRTPRVQQSAANSAIANGVSTSRSALPTTHSRQRQRHRDCDTKTATRRLLHEDRVRIMDARATLRLNEDAARDMRRPGRNWKIARRRSPSSAHFPRPIMSIAGTRIREFPDESAKPIGRSDSRASSASPAADER